MDKLIINGGSKLFGDVQISGAKNAVLPIMTATLIVPGNYKINNVPDLRDTRTMIDLLKIIGANVEYSDNTLLIDTKECHNPHAPYDLVKTMRASFYVLGPLLSRFHESKVSLPGGCAWGPRPVDFHIKALREMNVDVRLDKGDIIAKGQPKGCKIHFSKKSVGATGNILMAASRAHGVTKISNAAMEPEIVSLCHFLQKLGANIDGVGTEDLIISPIENENNSFEFDIIPDRIEAGTFMLAVAATGGKIKLKNVNTEHLESIIDHLNKINITTNLDGNEISITSDGEYGAIDMETLEFPGFPTDLQAQWMAVMLKAKGDCIIKENIYHDRFTHISELSRMGADITLKNNIAYIKGVDEIFSAPVMCTDIRASAGLIIAALCSKGVTEISRIYHIDRGYDGIENKLTSIGADIRRIKG